MSVPYCRRRLLPGEILGKACDGPDGCGHLLAVHIGVDHCPVCELVDLARSAIAQRPSEGATTINDWRRDRGLPPLANPSVSLQGDGASQPQAGDLLHIWSFGHCRPGLVTQAGNGRVDVDIDPGDRFGTVVSIHHDESRQVELSWHWPHGDDPVGRAETGPDTPGQVTINVTVQGSVLTERDLRRLIDQQLLRARYGDVDPSRFRR